MATTAKRRAAVDAVVRSLRTAEHSASVVAARFLAPDIVLDTNGIEIRDRGAVIDRISGQWAFTPVLAQGEWSLPENLGESLRVTAEFPGQGAAPSDYSLVFSFKDGDLISRIEETVFVQNDRRAGGLPASPRSNCDEPCTLANQTPVVLAYVDDNGAPSLSLRGSVQVYSPTQLCLWVRKPGSGLINSIRARRPLSFLYRNNPSRTTLVIRGRGKLVDDPKIVARSLISRPRSNNAMTQRWRAPAVIVDVLRVEGTSPKGLVSVVID